MTGSGDSVSLPDRILAYITKIRHVSMVEILREFPECAGKLAWVAGKDENVVFWEGVNEDFIAAVRDLKDRGAIHVLPTQFLVYFVDGAFLRLPIAHRPPPCGYKEPHWLPVILDIRDRAPRRSGAAR